MEIGFIGLGHMGSAMVKRLLQRGHRVTVFNRTPFKSDPLRALGAVAAHSPAEAAVDDLVVTMVSDDRALEEVLGGEDGVWRGMPFGGVHLSMSTISLELARKLEKEHGKRGLRFVGAPVLGRPPAAEKGELFILAGGEGKDLKRCEPALADLGQKIFLTGPSASSAHLMKILANFMLMSSVEAMAEALAVAKKSGLDRRLFMEVMTRSVFTAPFFRLYGDMMLEGNYEPASFGMPLALKDMRLASQAAALAEAPLPLGALLQDHAASAIAHGLGGLDLAALGRLAEENAGLAARP